MERFPPFTIDKQCYETFRKFKLSQDCGDSVEKYAKGSSFFHFGRQAVATNGPDACNATIIYGIFFRLQAGHMAKGPRPGTATPFLMTIQA